MSSCCQKLLFADLSIVGKVHQAVCNACIRSMSCVFEHLYIHIHLNKFSISSGILVFACNRLAIALDVDMFFFLNVLTFPESGGISPSTLRVCSISSLKIAPFPALKNNYLNRIFSLNFLKITLLPTLILSARFFITMECLTVKCPNLFA